MFNAHSTRRRLSADEAYLTRANLADPFTRINLTFIANRHAARVSELRAQLEQETATLDTLERKARSARGKHDIEEVAAKRDAQRARVWWLRVSEIPHAERLRDLYARYVNEAIL